MTTQDILRLSTSLQALNLAGHNLKFARKKKKRARDFIKVGSENIVGTSLIKTQAELIG